MTQAWEDLFTTSRDGLKLHARRYGDAQGRKTPVVCLPGLTRNTRDFIELAEHLAARGDRAIYAFDYRGRGESDYDPNWKNYEPPVELVDVLDMMTAFGIAEAVMVGTSRGGLLTMAMPMLRPGALRGAVLNDIGAEFDGRGLARIKSYVGKLPAPKTMAEAGSLFKHVSAGQFPLLTDAQWEDLATRVWKHDGEKLVLRYDPNLMKPLELLDLEQPLPTLWPQFESLSHVPVMVVRGANSDLLTQATAEEMTRRHPNCALLVVENEGHAPLLADAPTLARLTKFIEGCDRD